MIITIVIISKINSKINAADKKYTHRGCIEITNAEHDSMKNTISTLEDYVNNHANISKADISIDWSLKYIKLLGFLISALML